MTTFTKLPWRFLFRSRDVGPGDRILVVQSGSPVLFARLIDAVAERHPGATIAALVGRGAESAVPHREGVDYIRSQGANPAFVRELRSRGFEHVFLLLSDEPGYWKMKLLPFALGAAVIWAVNENLDHFPIDLRHAHNVAQHARRRLESSVTFAGAVRPWPIERLAKTALYPAVLGYLWAFERARTVRARTRGLPSWKRENRPTRHRDAA